MSESGLELYIKAIHAIYNEDVRDEDREKAVIVEPGAATTLSADQVIPTAKVTAEEINRFEALRFIYHNWEQKSGDVFEGYPIALLIESYELLELWTAKSYHSCVIRACSFFESYFIDITGISENASFSDAINAAASRDIITQNEKLLYHFVREVRNDCAHNNWLEIEYPTAVLVYACTTSNYLLGELMNRKLREFDPSSSTPVEAEPHHFLKKLKEDFQWKCIEDSGNISWEAPDKWEHPEDEKFSSYEQAYNSVIDDESNR